MFTVLYIRFQQKNTGEIKDNWFQLFDTRAVLLDFGIIPLDQEPIADGIGIKWPQDLLGVWIT